MDMMSNDKLETHSEEMDAIIEYISKHLLGPLRELRDEGYTDRQILAVAGMLLGQLIGRYYSRPKYQHELHELLSENIRRNIERPKNLPSLTHH